LFFSSKSVLQLREAVSSWDHWKSNIPTSYPQKQFRNCRPFPSSWKIWWRLSPVLQTSHQILVICFPAKCVPINCCY